MQNMSTAFNDFKPVSERIPPAWFLMSSLLLLLLLVVVVVVLQGLRFISTLNITRNKWNTPSV